MNLDKFEAFCWYHMTHYLKTPISEFHRGLMSATQSMRAAIAAPRGHAKTTYLSIFYPLYLILEEKKKVLLLSATGLLAEDCLGKIRNELDTNPTIREFYGDVKGGKWTNEEIQTKDGGQIMAKGAEKQIRGFRPDVIIADDLETDELVLSPDRLTKFTDWFWTALMGTLMPDKQVIVIGTILHPESFLMDLINKPREGWTTQFYQAIKDGKALWPEMWSLEELYKIKKERGEYYFLQEYMNEPIPDEKRVFQKKWIQYYEELPKNLVYFTTVDPASSLEGKADKTAIVTCGIDSNRNIFVVDVVNDQLLPSETIDTLFKLYDRYDISAIGIETEGFQKVLMHDFIQNRRAKKIYPRVVELKSGGRRKELRIQSLQPFFEDGKILIKRKEEDLVTQLLRFPSARCKDDIIDALAYMLEIIRPAKNETFKMNPDCFLSMIENKRKRQKDVWGNHRLRGEFLN